MVAMSCSSSALLALLVVGCFECFGFPVKCAEACWLPKVSFYCIFTLIRIWMRARICVARKWERLHDHHALFAGPDMGAQKASWQEAYAAEAAALAGMDYAQALLDLVKAFETVPHWVLVEAAKLKGYPIALLKLSLAAYRLARSIGVDGVYSRLIVATRGITAGSGFATSELRVLMLDLIFALQARWANIIITNCLLYTSGRCRRSYACRSRWSPYH